MTTSATASRGLRRSQLLAAAALAVAASLLGATSQAAAAPVGFSAPQFVDPGLAGGEPLVFADHKNKTLVYTSHEGTTHLYRDGLVTTAPSFYTNYRNQVNVWTSSDDGKSWQFTNFLGTGFVSNPAQNTGFSDPDLTQDAGGRIYNTGINLANDTLFSSADGGKTWDRGTVQCHEGDRPWLAGGRKDEVFLSTNTFTASGHEVYQSTDGGLTCSSTGIPANGTAPNGDRFIGNGKLFYLPKRDMLIEPAQIGGGLGVSTWKRGDASFTPGGEIRLKDPMQAHWPVIALDAADNIYLVWDSNARNNDTGGCNATGSPAPNSVFMAVSRDLGKTWSAPITIAHPGTRVLWPWVVAGDEGKVSVVWYQMDRVSDPDCEPAPTFIYHARIENAQDPAKRTVEVTNASGRSVNDSSICQGGTGCVATGQDRRLGDFFTNELDFRGCVMIASGDTTKKDPITGGELPTSLPIIIRQTSGPALRGDAECSGGKVAAATRGSCRDRTPPTSRVDRRSARMSRGLLALRGTARDRGCGKGRARVAGRVARIEVAVGRRVAGSRCRFLRSNGRFGRARRCSRATYVRARGTTRWYLNFQTRFPRGTYEVTVRARDARRNVERGHLAARRLRLRVR
jgi:hypothetical protein